MEVGKLSKLSVIYILVVLCTCTIESKSQKLLKLKWLRLQLGNWNLWHHLQVVTETNEKNLPSAT